MKSRIDTFLGVVEKFVRRKEESAMSTIELSVFDDETLATLAISTEIPADLSALDSYEQQFQDDVLPKGMGFGPRDYWKALKQEFHTLICGAAKGEPDPYTDLRKVIDKHGAKSQLAIVSSIAAFIGGFSRLSR